MDQFISTYGLVAVFLGVVLEGETVAVTGGIMAHRQLLVLWQVACAAIAGAFVTDLAVFLLGRRYRSHPRLQSVMARPAFRLALARLDRGPSLFAAAFRFIPGMRILGPLALAQSRITTLRFAALAGLAACIWGAFYVVAGQAMGHLLALVFGKAHRTEHVLIAAAVLIVLLAAYRYWFASRRPARPPAEG